MFFIQKLFSDPTLYIMWVLMVTFSVTCHEASHALVALWQGDNTAAESGHISLNPFKQMGKFSIFALLFFGIAWGAVPVNPYKLKKKYSHALVAFAGPFVNLLLFLLFSIGAAIVFVNMRSDAGSKLLQLFMTGGVLNIVLLLFNLIPVPPLDGWTVITYLIPGIHNVNQEVRNGIIFGLFMLLFFAFDKLFLAGNYCAVFTVKFFISLIA